jgi:protein-L-isoaspartate(D-aspartate) O-methyltransferase
MQRLTQHILVPLVGSALALSPAMVRVSGADETADRLAMVRTIEAHARSVADIVGPEGLSPRVLKVMQEVERHRFVPDDERSLAYADRPVDIGFGQTISQPFIVALMTHLLQPEPGDTVLEIGTGSGYQAAVLSPLVAKVCTVEIIPGLGERAAALLDELGYANIETRIADGYHGWPDCGPYDGIVVTAAADHVPPPLVEQLKPDGRMVIPVGGGFSVQYLSLVEKDAAGATSSRQLLPVRFVPFRRADE